MVSYTSILNCPSTRCIHDSVVAPTPPIILPLSPLWILLIAVNVLLPPTSLTPLLFLYSFVNQTISTHLLIRRLSRSYPIPLVSWIRSFWLTTSDSPSPPDSTPLDVFSPSYYSTLPPYSGYLVLTLHYFPPVFVRSMCSRLPVSPPIISSTPHSRTISSPPCRVALLWGSFDLLVYQLPLPLGSTVLGILLASGYWC